MKDDYKNINWDRVGTDDFDHYCIFNQFDKESIRDVISNIKNLHVQELFENNMNDISILASNGSAGVHKDDTSCVFCSSTTALYVIDCDDDIKLELFDEDATELEIINDLVNGQIINIEKNKLVIFNSNQFHRLVAKEDAKALFLNSTVDTTSISNIFNNMAKYAFNTNNDLKI